MSRIRRPRYWPMIPIGGATTSVSNASRQFMRKMIVIPPHERQDLAEHLDDRLRDDAVHESRVARDVRHEVASLPDVEKGQRHRLEVVHDRHAQVEDDLLARPGHHELAHAVNDRAHQQDYDKNDDELVEQPRLLQAEVEHALHDLRPDESKRGRDQEQYDGDPKIPPIRSDKSQESPIHRDRGSLLRGVAALAPHEHVDAPAAAHPDHSLLPATEVGGSRMVRANEVSHDHLHVSRRCQGRSHTVPKYSIPLYPTW